MPTVARPETAQPPSPIATLGQPTDQAPPATQTPAARADAPGAAQLAIVAASDQLAVGRPVRMRIVARHLQDLYGIQIQCTFDPALVEISDADASLPDVQATVGPAFPREASFVAANRVDGQEGRIDFSATLLGAVRALQGEVEILSFELTPTRAGEIRFEFSQVILADREANVLPAVYDGITFVVGS